MNHEIVELDEFSGDKAIIYSVIMEGDDVTLFDHFVEKHWFDFREELKFISDRLFSIGNDTGARFNFFKHDEGLPGDGVCALYDEPDRDLRLYCIRFGAVAIVLGGGGAKPKGVRSWQNKEDLKKEATTIIEIAKDINRRMADGEIQWGGDGTYLTGNLNFTDDDED